MSQASSKANPATAILICFLMIIGTVTASMNIEQRNPNATSQGIDSQYSDDNYTFRANPGANGENSYGVNTLRGAISSTSTPNAGGEVYDSYAWGQNTIQTAEGMQAADNTWTAVGGAYTNSASTSKVLDASITGGNTNSATLTLGWNAYDHYPGEYDQTGADLAIDFDGLYSGPQLPLTAGPAVTETFTLQTGETASCGQDIENGCYMNGWEVVLPMCGANNCTGASLDLTIDDLLPSITTNSACDALAYPPIPTPNSNNGGSGATMAFTCSGGTPTITGVTVTVSGVGYRVGDTITIPVGAIHPSQVTAVVITLVADDLLPTHDTTLYVGNGVYALERVNWALSTSSVDTFLVYTYSPYGGQPFKMQVKECEDCEWITVNNGDTKTIAGKVEYNIQMTGSGTNKHYKANHATPISGFTPSASGCDDTPSIVDVPLNLTSEGFTCGSLPTTTSIWVKESAIIFSVGIGDMTGWNATTLDFVQYDPSANFWDNMNADEEQDGNWRVGVDRDGCDVYRYPCSNSGQNDHYADYEIGDGWCGDNSVDWDEGNAACRFSGVTGSIFGFGSNNWDALAWNTAMSALPVFDTTSDFDGIVIKAEIDKNQFLGQGQTGWFDMALELGLQAPAYTDGSWYPGVVGDGGWFEACFNGYVDVYILPENVWEYWYQDAKYGYNKFNDVSHYGDTWQIVGDGDVFSSDEYWYEVGQTAGSGANGNGYQFPHSSTSYDRGDANYWAHPNWVGFQNGNPQLPNADMKVNQWHQSLNEDGVTIYDTNVENDWLYGGGWYNKPGDSGDSDAPEFLQSSFGQINDFWDINIYDDDDYDSNDPPLGAAVAGDYSGLSVFHVNTIRLGTSTTDFCYDPITSNANNRQDATGISIDPSQHIKHDTTSGETVLNIEIPYTSVFANAATRSSSQLENSGWIDSLADSTVGLTILIDVRGYGGQQSEVCWGDWATGTNEIDDISDNNDDFCLDQNGAGLGLPGSARNNIAFNDFIDETPCVGSMPTSGQQAGQNPDQAFWCGLNFDTPFSDWENIRIMAQSQPYVPPTDSDGDGVIDAFDDCPNTALGTQVNAAGCATGGGGGGGGTPSADNTDSDGDGVMDSWDRCDGVSDFTPSSAGFGGATDYPWYSTPDPVTSVTPQQAWETLKTNVDAEGCPTPTGGGGNDNIEECNNMNTPDVGLYSYEDNDGDGPEDEDWIDGIDNDGDGLIDEDWLDDCPYDGIDRSYDGMWNGQLSVGQATHLPDGSWNAHQGQAARAENGTGIASDNPQYIMGAGDDAWYAAYASATPAEKHNQANAGLVLDDGYMTERFTCDASGVNGQSQIRMFIYAFIYLEEGDNVNTSANSVQSPYGDGFVGKWVPYGSAHFDGVTLSPHHGWASDTSRMHNIHSSTSPGTNGYGIVANVVQKEVVMAEGYYKIECVSTVPHTTSAGQSTWAQGASSLTILASEPCSEGYERSEALGECTVVASGGGSDIGEQGVAFWDALIGSAIAIGVLIIFIALSAALWFIDRKEGAIGLAIIGVGVAAAFFVNSVDLESSSANLWGTGAHLLIVAGAITAFWPYEGEPAKTAGVSMAIGIWGLLHVLSPSMGGIEEYLIPAITGIPILVTVIGIALGLFATAVQFQLVDDPTGIID